MPQRIEVVQRSIPPSVLDAIQRGDREELSRMGRRGALSPRRHLHPTNTPLSLFNNTPPPNVSEGYRALTWGGRLMIIEPQREWGKSLERLAQWISDPSNWEDECRKRDIEAHLDTHPID